MRELHLFAGIGGGILGGALLGHEARCAVEIDPFCRQILSERFPRLDLHDDIRTFHAHNLVGQVDVVCGGFPCQPWSVAGKRKGTADPRHLWPEMARVISEARAPLVFAENVQIQAFEEPLRDLRAMGYRVLPALQLSAADCGAPHIRKRWWLLAAHPDAYRQGGLLESARARHRGSQRQQDGRRAVHVGQEVADALRAGLPLPELAGVAGATGEGSGEVRPAAAQRGWWSREPDVGGGIDGFSTWVDGSNWLAEAHKLLLAYGYAQKVSPAQALQALRRADGQDRVQWEARGRRLLSAQEVLFAFLRQLEAAVAEAPDAALARQEAQEGSMRGVRADQAASRAPLRWKPSKQRRRESADPLRALSQLLARNAEQAWLAYRRQNAATAFGWESGIARTAHGVPNRVDRLRALGNAQVPAQAALAFHLLFQQLL